MRVLLVLALLLVANGIAVRLTSEPLEAVRARAEEMHGEGGSLSPLDGGYSAGLLGMTAYGSFATDGDQVVEVTISRPFAFMPWQLETYSAHPAGD